MPIDATLIVAGVASGNIRFKMLNPRLIFLD